MVGGRNRYYLSKAWAGNLRRFVEAQARKRRHSPTSGGKGRSRGRERAESNLMPPWDDVNADLVCQHGGLAHSTQSSRGKVGKRRQIPSVLCSRAAFGHEHHRCRVAAFSQSVPREHGLLYTVLSR